MSGFSTWYQKQLSYWSAYQSYAQKWFSKPENVKAYQESVIISQKQAAGVPPTACYLDVNTGKFYCVNKPSYKPSWWEQLLANLAYAGSTVVGILGNPLGATAAQTIQEYYYKPTGQQPPQPWSTIHHVETQENPWYRAGTQAAETPKVIVNVQNTLGNIGKAIQDAFKYMAQVLGQWGPIILLIIILYLVVRLIRG